MDENLEAFLKTVTDLGGYCTVEQAKALKLANSDTRVLAQLRGLEVLDSSGEWPLTRSSIKSPDQQPACLVGIVGQGVCTLRRRWRTVCWR
jgi:hypothetical protein